MRREFYKNTTSPRKERQRWGVRKSKRPRRWEKGVRERCWLKCLQHSDQQNKSEGISPPRHVHIHACIASFRKPEETFWRQRECSFFPSEDSSYAYLQTWEQQWEELGQDTFSERWRASNEQVPCPQRYSEHFNLEWRGHSASCPPVASLIEMDRGSGKDTCVPVKI